MDNRPGDPVKRMVACLEKKGVVTATHAGMLAGIFPGMTPIPATGKKIAFPSEHVDCTVKDGKVFRVKVDSKQGWVAEVLAQLGHATK